MKNQILSGLIAVSLLQGGCKRPKTTVQKDLSTILSQTEKTNETDTEVEIHYLNGNFTLEQKKTIDAIIQNYNNFYACEIDSMNINQDDREMKSAGRQTGGTGLAHTESGIINFNQTNIKTLSLAILENTTIHEMFHAIKPTTGKTIHPYAMTVRNQYEIIGFSGLSIIMKIGQHKGSYTTVLEEAAAEACANNFKPHYSVGSLHYVKAATLMLNMISQGRITPQDLIRAQKTNDPYSIVQKILNSDQISNEDLEAILLVFEKVVDTDEEIVHELITEIITEIQKIRDQNNN